MGNLRKLALGAAISTGAAALLAAAPANAAIVLCYEVGNTDPQCGPTDSNVNVDKVDGVFVVGGHLNNNVAQLVTFTGGELLNGDGNGQAEISATDGSLNTWLEFALTDATFNLATFNLNPLNGNANGKADSVQISYIPTYGGSPITYTLDTNGQNFYGIWGSAGEQLTSIRFENFLPAGDGVADLRQVRVAGVQAAVPEPSTWAMLLIGFGAIGTMLRRRKTLTGTGRLRAA